MDHTKLENPSFSNFSSLICSCSREDFSHQPETKRVKPQKTVEKKEFFITDIDRSEPALAVGSLYVFDYLIAKEPLLAAVSKLLSLVPTLGGVLKVQQNRDGIEVGISILVDPEKCSFDVKFKKSPHSRSCFEGLILQGKQQEWLQNGEHQAHLPPLPDRPLAWMEVTELVDGGTVVGIATHHFLCDASGNIGVGLIMSRLIQGKSLSPNEKLSECRHLLSLSRDVPIDQTLPSLWCDLRREGELKKEQKGYEWGEWTKRPNVATFYDFSLSEIESLQNSLLSFLSSSKDFPLHPEDGYFTPNDVVVAKIWVCIQTARQLAHAPVSKKFCMAVDFRNRFDPPLPSTYFGNLILTSKHSLVPSSTSDPSSDLWSWLQFCELAPSLSDLFLISSLIHNDLREQVRDPVIRNTLQILKENGGFSPFKANLPSGELLFSRHFSFLSNPQPHFLFIPFHSLSFIQLPFFSAGRN